MYGASVGVLPGRPRGTASPTTGRSIALRLCPESARWGLTQLSITASWLLDVQEAVHCPAPPGAEPVPGRSQPIGWGMGTTS
ncbi:hypothetical protein AB0929_25865 [Streptomyces massasporeus]|uniref:hypothetical protein n=1 Tax=Streptomyces massasporeus TaxID=67324 RepID=UPI0034564D6F